MARGYYNYRGRSSKGKVLLAVFLVLVILASLSALAMQRYIAYDESGAPFFRLPEEEAEEPVPPVEEDPPLVIQEEPALPEEAPQEVAAPSDSRVFSLPVGTLTADVWASAREEMGEVYGAAAVTLKGTGGAVYYASEAAPKKAVRTVKGTMDAISAITGDEDVYAIACLSCLPDAYAPYMNNKPMGLKNKSTRKMFRAGGTAWLDPGQTASREYLCALAGEIAALGFDEILLTDTGYPTQGKLEELNYGEGTMDGNLASLWASLRETLAPYGVKLSIVVPESVVSDGQEAASGLVLSQVVRYADRVYSPSDPRQAGLLSDLVLQAEGEKVAQEFLPVVSAAPEGYDGGYLLLPREEQT